MSACTSQAQQISAGPFIIGLTSSTANDKPNVMDKLFHHDKKSHEQSQTQPAPSTTHQEPKKLSEMDKLKAEVKQDEKKFHKYIEKDEAGEREGTGDEYGGLM